MDLHTTSRHARPMRPMPTLSLAPAAASIARAPVVLGALGLLLAALAALGPVLPQDPHFHAFADQRSLVGLPCALDVLSNLPFLLFGLWGLLRVATRPGQAAHASQRSMVALFFAGLVLTAFGSSAYHWRPDDLGLLWDRLGMVVAFAGVVGLAVDSRIGARAGRWTAVVMAAGGALGAWICWRSGNLLPWAVVQGGGMLLVLGLAFVRSRAEAWHVPLAAVIAWYVLAKALEMGDVQVFAWTQQTVSGHSLKHLAAACAALPVLLAWGRPERL